MLSHPNSTILVIYGHFSWIEYIQNSEFDIFSETKHIWYSVFGKNSTARDHTCADLVPGAWLDSHCPRVSLFTPDSAPTPVSTVGAESGRGEAPEPQRASAGASLTLTEPELSLSLCTLTLASEERQSCVFNFTSTAEVSRNDWHEWIHSLSSSLSHIRRANKLHNSRETIRPSHHWPPHCIPLSKWMKLGAYLTLVTALSVKLIAGV